MPLTEEQKKVRQKHFPGRRGFLPPDQMELFRQYCAEAGCPLEDGVYKRPRASPAGTKDEAPDWVPDLVPRQRKPKRKADSVYSFDSSEGGGGHGASYGRAAAAAAAAAGLGDQDDRIPGRNGLELGDVDSGSSGEDFSHRNARLSTLQLHLQQLQQQQQQGGQQQQQQLRLDSDGGFDPTAAAAAAVAAAARDGVLISPAALNLQDPSLLLDPAAAAAALSDAAAAAAAGEDAVHPAAAEAVGRALGSFTGQRPPGGLGFREPRPSDDAVRSLMHLRASSPEDAAAADPAAAAAAAAEEPDHPSLEEFEQQQQQQQQERHEEQQQHHQQYVPVLAAVSTGRGGGRTGRPRGRPPTRGRGRGGRPRIKREIDHIHVSSPLHPVHPGAGVYHHGSADGGVAAAAAAAAERYPGPYGGIGERVQGHGSTLARLTHAAAMAEGMGTRGDRSRPDDYYQVYTEYFAAQEAYHRLMGNLASHPMLHSVPEPEVPEKLYGPAYAGRVQDSSNMLAAAAAIDLLSPGSLAASRRKRHPAPATAAAADGDQPEQDEAAAEDKLLAAAVAEQQQARNAVTAAAQAAAEAEAAAHAAAVNALSADARQRGDGVQSAEQGAAKGRGVVGNGQQHQQDKEEGVMDVEEGGSHERQGGEGVQQPRGANPLALVL